MDLNQFTTKAQQAVFDAQRRAEAYSHSELEPAHLLLALLNQADGVVPQVLSKVGARPQSVVADLERQLADRPKVHGATAQIGATAADLQSAQFGSPARFSPLTQRSKTLKSAWSTSLSVSKSAGPQLASRAMAGPEAKASNSV